MVSVNQLRLALKSPPKTLKVVLVICLLITTEYITVEVSSMQVLSDVPWDRNYPVSS